MGELTERTRADSTNELELIETGILSHGIFDLLDECLLLLVEKCLNIILALLAGAPGLTHSIGGFDQARTTGRQRERDDRTVPVFVPALVSSVTGTVMHTERADDHSCFTFTGFSREMVRNE